MRSKPGQTPFVGQEETTFADVIAWLSTTASIRPARRRDLLCGLRRFSDFAKLPPEALSTNGQRRSHFRRAWHHTRLGVSRKTLQNVFSNVAAAIALYSGDHQVVGNRTPMAADWQRLYDVLKVKRLRIGLRRLLRFCSNTGVRPGGVTDAAIEDFMAALARESISSDLPGYRRKTCRLWNLAADTVPGWPQRRLTLPDRRRERRTVRICDLPSSFQADVEQLFKRMRSADPTDEAAPARPARPITIVDRQVQIEILVSVLVRAGRPLDSITSLKDLVSKDTMRQAVLAYMNPVTNQPRPMAHGLVSLILMLAKRWVDIEPQELALLKRMAARLPKQVGLTEKNKALLRQFDDDGNRWRLLELPWVEAAKAEARRAGSHRAAIQHQLALAVAISLCAPMRLKNLASLKLGHSLVRPGGKSGPWVIALPGSEVKNDEPLEFRVPARVAVLLDRHLEAFRPRLAAPGNDFLFPGPNGHKDPHSFGTQITDLLTDRLGFKMTQHQFRHAAAKFILDAHPEAYAIVQRLLGHRKLETTISSYAGQRTRQAFEFYDNVMQKTHAALSAPKVARRMRRAA